MIPPYLLPPEPPIMIDQSRSLIEFMLIDRYSQIGDRAGRAISKEIEKIAKHLASIEMRVFGIGRIEDYIR